MLSEFVPDPGRSVRFIPERLKHVQPVVTQREPSGLGIRKFATSDTPPKQLANKATCQHLRWERNGKGKVPEAFVIRCKACHMRRTVALALALAICAPGAICLAVPARQHGGLPKGHKRPDVAEQNRRRNAKGKWITVSGIDHFFPTWKVRGYQLQATCMAWRTEKDKVGGGRRCAKCARKVKADGSS